MRKSAIAGCVFGGFESEDLRLRRWYSKTSSVRLWFGKTLVREYLTVRMESNPQGRRLLYSPSRGSQSRPLYPLLSQRPSSLNCCAPSKKIVVPVCDSGKQLGVVIVCVA
jgi:hypothetical protein